MTSVRGKTIDVQFLFPHQGQAGIIALVRAMRDCTGNLPPLPGIFPDNLAPIARNAPDGVRELAMARWGMPGPPAFGGAPITNIRNVKSPHWRAWLKPENRCVVPFTSFCEYADTKPRKTPTWFALSEDRPLAVFAGIWTTCTASAARRRTRWRVNMRIPIYSGRVFRREAGQGSDLKPASIPR
jgi:putative SOS response-associated peptidase YedK